MFLNRDASEFEIVAADTASDKTWLDKGIRLPLDAFPIGTVIDEGRPLIRSEIKGDEFPIDKLLVEEGIVSEVILPLTSEGQVLGSFNLGSFIPDAYSMEDVEMLLPMARQLGLIIDNAKLLQDIKRFDLVDKLTKLYNHRFFFEALSREIARSRRDSKPISVMILDIVGFREFNREMTRAQGDRILMGIADVVRGSVREIDIAARYSGDKFAVLLPDASAGGGGKDNEVMRIADRIQGEIDEKIFDEDASTLTLCIGISEFPTHADDPVTILEQADWAVRQARNAGNGCVMVAGDSSSGTAAETD
jgi:diguanylate cyclase (GGDEF)-like protein